MVKEKYVNSVLEVKRVSDRMVILKMEFGWIPNECDQYVCPTGGIRVGGKGRILEWIEDYIQIIPREERIGI